jgi:hypothetical protein
LNPAQPARPVARERRAAVVGMAAAVSPLPPLASSVDESSGISPAADSSTETAAATSSAPAGSAAVASPSGTSGSARVPPSTRPTMSGWIEVRRLTPASKATSSTS